MLGGMLSGTLETPGQIYTKMDKKVKQIRGMAGILSNYRKSAKMGDDTKFLETITPEGVEGYVDPTGLVSTPAVAEGAEALVDMTKPFTISSIASENLFTVVSDGVSGLITIPEGNYRGSTLAAALESRINQMVNPVSGEAVGGVQVVYDEVKNNLTFTTATTGEGSVISVNGAIRFGLNDVPLGLGDESQVRTPVQAQDELGRPLFISPTGEVTTNNQDFVDNRGWVNSKSNGKMRLEGKEYTVKDGDVLNFRFNT